MNGRFKAGEPLKGGNGIIDTGDRGRRYTGFVHADINGDGHDDIILTRDRSQNVVYYPRLTDERKVKLCFLQ